MKYLESFKLFESIIVDLDPKIKMPDPQLHSHERTMKQFDFNLKEFNRQLIDRNLVENIKDYLSDIQDLVSMFSESQIKISFKRCIPVFEPKSNIGDKTGPIKDIMIIEIGRISHGELNKLGMDFNVVWDVLKTTALEIRSFVRDYNLDVAICDSYLYFDTIENFFQRNYVKTLDPTIIIF